MKNECDGKCMLSESDTKGTGKRREICGGGYSLNQLYNEDCMEAMKQIPDKYFQLAITDPPYGIGIDGQKLKIEKNPKQNRKLHKKMNWDKAIPGAEYFRELERISENQIIWGGNYFVEHLQQGHKGWIVWDKGQRGLTMSDCELAYTSFDSPTRIVIINRVELLKDGTFHPTQKPVKLYEWILSNYAKTGDRIIDTHAGSGASCVACHRLRFEWLAFEVNQHYFTEADKRIKAEQAQMTIFDLMGGGDGWSG